jgi:2-phosphosulfolactate phosphatase
MIDVALTPADLKSMDAGNAQVVVLDVLRASTTIVMALANGAREVRMFDTHERAAAARDAFISGAGGGVKKPTVLGGEKNCLKAPGFDLGNSPREYTTENIGGSTIFLATTNGTRAAVAAQDAGARRILIGGIINAGATAGAVVEELSNMDTILLCAGTNGRPACEDLIGAGAILFSILGQTYRPDLPFGDLAWSAYHAFTAVRPRLGAALRLGAGGVNVIEAGLEDDIDVCAAIDSRAVVVEVDEGLVARKK